MLLKFVCFFHYLFRLDLLFLQRARNTVLLFVSRTLKIKLLYAAAATIATATIVVVVVVEHPRPGRPLKLATMILIRVKV